MYVLRKQSKIKGIIPVIYDTENNFDFKYAMDMGMEATPVYGEVDVETVDPETGEITITTEERIIEYDGPFFYFNNSSYEVLSISFMAFNCVAYKISCVCINRANKVICIIWAKVSTCYLPP